MFERLKRLWKSIAAEASRDRAPEDEPESFDHPRPKRVNQNPPNRDWFARVRERSHQARAEADTKALDRLDERGDPKLSRDASRQVDELFEKTLEKAASPPRQ